MEHPRSYGPHRPQGDGGTQAAAPPQPAKVTVTASATGDQVTFDMPAQIKPGRPS